MGVIPYGRQDISPADIEVVVATLRGDFLTQGPAVGAFEDAFAKYCGASHAVAVANGTAGLHIAYLAAGIGAGDAVVVPSITFAATANAALYCGATPVFCDVDADTGLMDVASARSAVDIAMKAGLQVKAIVPVHYAGRPCDLDKLHEVATEVGAIIVEDACHAAGAEFRSDSDNAWRKVGNSAHADMAVFSFHPVKHLTTGEGGIVTTNDAGLAKRLRLLRTHGINRDPDSFENQRAGFDPASGQANVWYHEMQELGLNYRLCDIQAALGRSQLERLPEFVSRRRQIAAIYDDQLSDVHGVKPARVDSERTRHSYHLYPLRVDWAVLHRTRHQFMGELRTAGIGSQVHYIPVQAHPFYQRNQKLWLETKAEKAWAFYEAELSIPMYPAMTDACVEKVVKEIKLATKKAAR